VVTTTPTGAPSTWTLTGWTRWSWAPCSSRSGLLNLALGIPGPSRIPVFWAGLALLAATILYGVVGAVKDAFG
jgi:hypothetical protein